MRKYTRKFGIEFEFECSWERLKKCASKAIKNTYGPRKYYAKEERFSSDFQTNKWHIKEENTAVSELTTPISTLRDVKSICEVIDELRKDLIRPQEDCGIHIHIDVPDIDIYHIMSGWLLSERAIISCFPAFRRRNGFCEKILDHPSASRSQIAKYLENKTDMATHSEAIDLTGYQDNKTIEIRLCEGSVDPEWIRAWIIFVINWVEFVKAKNPSLLPCEKCNSLDFEHLLDEMHLDKKTESVMKDRYERYKKDPYWV